MVIWNDNGVVAVRSNCKSIQWLSNSKRWSKEAKDYINVPRTAMIGCYNSPVGGMNQMDQSVASYCPS